MVTGEFVENEEQLSFEESSLFKPSMTVQAMRDSRYRHPANALAELIDNSIDANASVVEVLITERQHQRWAIDEIAVFDNGHGMDSQTLVQALRFGGHVSKGSATGRIGKYGMGLPTASVSQCRRVDVWTWDKDIEQAYHSYIDIKEVEEGSLDRIPEAKIKAVPHGWRNRVQQAANPHHGTLVVWSDLDRITSRSATIFAHVEREIGRIYRHYISDGELKIRMASFRDALLPENDGFVLPNDPLFLMSPSTTSEPYADKPMFKEYARRNFDVIVNGKQEQVRVIYSIAQQEALGLYGGHPGNSPYGKDAMRNMGISVVREDREMLLENMFIREGGGNAQPMNRWWGCEVQFSSACDDIFGVDHNKQMAANFSSAAKNFNESMEDDSEVYEEDYAGVDDIYDIVKHIRSTTRAMMRELDRMFAQRPKPHIVDPETPPSPEQESEILLTKVTQEDIGSGALNKTSTDIEREELENTKREQEIKSAFIDKGFSEDDAAHQAHEAVFQDMYYKFVNSVLSGSNMFSVTREGAILVVNLNIHHPIHKLLREIEDTDSETDKSKTLHDSSVSIRAMLLALARMEDEIEDPVKRIEFQDTCYRWGRMVMQVLNEIRQ